MRLILEVILEDVVNENKRTREYMGRNCTHNCCCDFNYLGDEMKKKIKLEAWRQYRKPEIKFLIEGEAPYPPPGGGGSNNEGKFGWDRAPEYDIEKEIEVPDEERKARERWIIAHPGSLELRAFNSKEEAEHRYYEGFNPATLYREVLPGEIVTTEERLRKIYMEHLYYHPTDPDVEFSAFLKALKG